MEVESRGLWFQRCHERAVWLHFFGRKMENRSSMQEVERIAEFGSPVTLQNPLWCLAHSTHSKEACRMDTYSFPGEVLANRVA